VLVCLFLRGGMDGLHVVPPYGDSHYARQRPSLAVPGPDARGAGAQDRAVNLDSFFGLHPALGPLHEPYAAGHLAVVHACGTPDKTRSHFEAMETMERGVDNGATAASGWLGRHITAVNSGNRSPLRALALGETLPQSLQGAMGAIAVTSLSEFRLGAPAAWAAPFRATMAALYEGGDDPAAVAGRETLALLATMEKLDPRSYRPAAGATYPAGDFGTNLKQIAQLIKADVGLEVACLDLGGWDSHYGQLLAVAGPVRDLGQGLAAFWRDLGNRIDRVTLVAMSEFGRRAYENSSFGTDHGRATCMFLLGGGIAGGRVISRWPGLADAHLDGPGDLAVTTDYRDILGEVVRERLRNPRVDQVFPNHPYAPRGVTRSLVAASG
jgi:uncharacterized protein (DUF1501 family)